MGKQYKKKESTGREYVDAAKEFCTVTTFRCLQLPQRWNSVLLEPMIKTAQRIEENVVYANSIYVNNSLKPDALEEAYKQRDEILQETLRLFAVFDVQFDRLVAQTEVAKAEKARLKNIVLSILKSEQENNPGLKNIEIRVVSRGDEMEYTSVSEKKCMKLKLTAQNKDNWLKTEADALKFIREKLDADKRALAALNK